MAVLTLGDDATTPELPELDVVEVTVLAAGGGALLAVTVGEADLVIAAGGEGRV